MPLRITNLRSGDTTRTLRGPIHQISGVGWFKKTQLFRVYFCVVHELSPFIFSNFLANLNLKNATAVCGIPFLQHTKDSPAINASWFLRTWEVGKNGRMQVATRADSNKKDSDKKQLASSSKRKQETIAIESALKSTSNNFCLGCVRMYVLTLRQK